MSKSGDPIESELESIDQEDAAPSGKSIMRFAPAAGAVFALAAFAGITWYAYNTGIREGSEFAAPVLKPSGPSKIAPESPGGEDVPHRKKQVYSLVDKMPVSNRIERLAPRPETPLAPPVASPNLKSPPAPPILMIPPPPSITGKRETPDRSWPAITPAPTIAPKGLEATKSAKPSAQVAESQKSAPKVVEAPPPPIPPKQLQQGAVKTPVIQSPTTIAPVSPKPKVSTLRTLKAPPSGVYLIQIASLRSADAAQRAWDLNVKKNSSLFRDLKLFVAAKIIPGRGEFFRVQVGPFATRDAAVKRCAAFKKSKIPCLVIRP